MLLRTETAMARHQIDVDRPIKHVYELLMKIDLLRVFHPDIIETELINERDGARMINFIFSGIGPSQNKCLSEHQTHIPS
eukprot:UN27311